MSQNDLHWLQHLSADGRSRCVSQIHHAFEQRLATVEIPNFLHQWRACQTPSISPSPPWEIPCRLCSWEAVIVVMDSKPFHDLAAILNRLQDHRIWVFAEWIGPQFAPKAEGVWLPNYHQVLYDLTDEAIRACSPHTRPEPP